MLYRLYMFKYCINVILVGKVFNLISILGNCLFHVEKKFKLSFQLPLLLRHWVRNNCNEMASISYQCFGAVVAKCKSLIHELCMSLLLILNKKKDNLNTILTIYCVE